MLEKFQPTSLQGKYTLSFILGRRTEYGRYVPQGSTDPTEYPQSIYGTEVFEVNDNLRQLAIGFAKTAVLNDSTAAMAYRANYASTSAYEAGSQGPSVVGCDVATSDVYFSGTLLSEAFENTTKLFTNGSGVYWYVFYWDDLSCLVLKLSHETSFRSRRTFLIPLSDSCFPYIE